MSVIRNLNIGPRLGLGFGLLLVLLAVALGLSVTRLAQLGDTIGRGTPDAARRMLEACLQHIPASALAGHYHDTYGMAIANIAASLEMGLRTFDSSVSGLGGCPYAAGASGNVATEDVVYLLNGMGHETGIDLPRLGDAGAFISAALGRPNASRVARALGCT